MAKSIVSILTGIAIQDGKIKSIDEHVSDFIPSYKTGMDSLLTIKDLTTMRTRGINFAELYQPFCLSGRGILRKRPFRQYPKI